MRIPTWLILSILALLISSSSLSATTAKYDRGSNQSPEGISSDSLLRKNQQLPKVNVVSGDKDNSQIATDLGVNKSQEEEKSQDNIPKRILALFAFKQALPWTYRMEESLRATLTTNPPFPIELNVEHADLARNPEKEYTQKLLDFYKQKYSFKKLDLILAIGDESAVLIAEYGEELFGSTPIVLVTSDKGILPPSLKTKNMTSFVWGWDGGATIGLIDKVLPKVNNLYLISGTSQTDLAIRKNVLKSLQLYEKRFDIKFITDFVTSEMVEQVGQLPEDSAIFFLSVVSDINNEYFVPRDLVHIVSSNANVPTFGMGDTYLGQGIVGGSLVSAEVQGKRFADISVKLLSGVPLSEKDINSSNLYMFDWRELKRWSINETDLPSGSIIQFKEETLWTQYRIQIILIFAFILSQGLAIIYLLHQRQIRLKSESKEKQSRTKAELLAGKLLKAQESERALISRELHDDITQRLAVLNIQVDNIEIKTCDDETSLKESLQEVGTSLGDLSSDVHMLSRQLHPSILYDLGLVKALESECHNFSKNQKTTLDVDLDSALGNLPEETGLCLYRILQEGLRNIAKHANAQQVRVRLYRENGRIYFLIEDDGKGFDPDEVRKKPGIGLSSMTERARLINGELSIQSNPGQGTKILMTLENTKQTIIE